MLEKCPEKCYSQVVWSHDLVFVEIFGDKFFINPNQSLQLQPRPPQILPTMPSTNSHGFTFSHSLVRLITLRDVTDHSFLLADGQRIKSESPSPAQSPPQIESDLARIESQLGESTMANPADRRPEGGFKQDYISSTRYRNDLPPPPMPPKLLDIPHGGLAQYLTPGYASNLARREEPNIEVDAEGGMPIDMVGVPGYMFGDETGMF